MTGKDGSKPAAVTVLLLRSFADVLWDRFRGEHFTYSIDPLKPVPENSLILWKKRGYEPCATGVALVAFEGVQKEYTFPAYFWSE